MVLAGIINFFHKTAKSATKLLELFGHIRKTVNLIVAQGHSNSPIWSQDNLQNLKNSRKYSLFYWLE